MKKQLYSVLIIALALMLFSSCSENYSNGERIGLVTQFSKSGILWKTWEGELHVTQTGMNSTMHDFQFSLDNDNTPDSLVNQIDSAAQHGWKVKLTYHETQGKNWFQNRGETDHFVTKVEVLDRNMSMNRMFNREDSTEINRGHIIDTIYVIIDKSKN